MNLEGSERPLAWCFQGFHEFQALAHALGPDQPLFGMRSGHHVVDYNDSAAIDGLAALYLDELAAAPGGVPMRLGGNCQGAVVAVAMARRRVEQGKLPPTLFLLEDIAARVDPRPLPVPVALLFGQYSRDINPYYLFPDPTPGWDRLYPAGYSVDLIEADHGNYFRKPGIASLVDRLAARLAQPPGGAGAVDHGDAPVSLDDMHADLALTGPAPASLQAGETRTLEVAVTARGARTWHPSDAMIVGNHWLAEDEAVAQWLDGHTPLEQPLEPGACRRVPLAVTAPPDAGAYLLEIDLAEQGVAWFAERGNRPLRLPIRVARHPGA